MTVSGAQGTTGSGMIVLFPNTPTSHVGTHYIRAADGTYVLDQEITTAQDLPEMYNYSRKVSSITTIRSSTLPAGVYALNGTFNAVRYDGLPSEIGLPEYGNLLQATTNIMDKIGNVLVGDGITVLGLPTGAALPYYRLGDKSPTDIIALKRSIISDDHYSLKYYVSSSHQYSIQKSSNVHADVFRINVDSPTKSPVVLQGTWYAYVDWPAGSTGTEDLVGVEFEVDVLDIAGVVIDTSVVEWYIDHISKGTADPKSYDKSLTISMLPGTRPCAAVLIRARFGTLGGADPSSVRVSFENTVVSAPGASYPGLLSSVVLVAYEDMAAGTTITISGVHNYELVPDPLLARNLQTEYTQADPEGMKWAQMILSHRDKLGIRSVWMTKDYNAKSSYLQSLASPTTAHVAAMGLGFGDIIKGIGRVLVPIANSIIPGLGDVGKGVVNGLGGLLGIGGTWPTARGAAGFPIGIGAAGTPIGRRYFGADETLVIEPLDPEEHESGEPPGILDEDTSTVPPVLSFRDDKTVRLWLHGPPLMGFDEGSLYADRGALAPGLIVNTEDETAIEGIQLFCAVNGDLRRALHQSQRRRRTRTTGRHRIFGLDMSYLPVDIDCDVTILPVTNWATSEDEMRSADDPKAVLQPFIDVAQDETPVLGRSYMAAITWAGKMNSQSGLPPVVMTGATRGDTVLPNSWAKIKKRLVEEIDPDLFFAANWKGTTSPITSTTQVLAHGPWITRRLSATKRARLPGIPKKMYMGMDDMILDPDTGEFFSASYLPGMSRMDQVLAPQPTGNVILPAEVVQALITPAPTPEVPQVIPQIVPQAYRPTAAPRNLTPQRVAELALSAATPGKARQPYQAPPRRSYTNPEVDQARQEFLAAGERLLDLDPNFAKQSSVMEQIDVGGLTDILYDYLMAPGGVERLYTVLDNTRPVAGSRAYRGPSASTEAADKEAKADKIARSMKDSGIKANADWVAANGWRGPSEKQVHFYHATGELPDPGEHPSLPTPARDRTLAAKVKRSADSIFSGNPTAEQYAAVEDIYNRKDGKGPDQKQSAELREMFGFKVKKPSASTRPRPAASQHFGRPSNRYQRYADEQLD